MQMVFMNECKSSEISNQMFFNVMFSFAKTKDKLIMKYVLQNKTIQWHRFAESEAYIEPSQRSTRERFCKNS